MLTNAVAPDKVGGLERYVRGLAAALVRTGADVTVLAKRLDDAHPPRERGDDGVLIVRHPVPTKTNPLFGALYPLVAAQAVLRETRDSRAVLHSHFPLQALPLALLRRPYVHTFHAPVYKELIHERHGSYFLPAVAHRPAVAGLQAAERAVVRRAAGLVVLSEFVRAEVGALDRVAGERAVTIPGGLDVDRFAPGPGIQDPWAADAEPLLFAARRLTPRTGVDTLIDAMPAVREALPRARLAVAGSGLLEEELGRKISAHGLADSVRLLGRLPDDELVRWYRAASVVVMPTRELEGFGLSTIEALACGTPVVATPVGANPEVLRPLHPALIARGKSSADLAGAVIDVWRQPALLEEIRRRGREHVVQTAGWDCVARRYLDVYRELDAGGIG